MRLPEPRQLHTGEPLLLIPAETTEEEIREKFIEGEDGYYHLITDRHTGKYHPAKWYRLKTPGIK